MHPLRDATQTFVRAIIQVRISIHASLAGCNIEYSVTFASSSVFQFMHPFRDATISERAIERIPAPISTLASIMGCNPTSRITADNLTYFNSCIPCGMQRYAADSIRSAEGISIHAFRKECSHVCQEVHPNLEHFNSCTPCWVQRYRDHLSSPVQVISIHASHTGSNEQFKIER